MLWHKIQGAGGFGGGGPWDLSGAVFNGGSLGFFKVATEETSPTALFFKDDGTKMYILGTSGDDVNEYSLSTAWNVLTASYVQNFSVATEDSNFNGLFFKPDGTKMFLVGMDGDDVNEYSLSTAWDISTASYVQNFSVATEENLPAALFFKPDGTKMFVTGLSGDDVNEYSLSTAWDISTASYVQNFSVSAQENSPRGLFFKDDGTKMYVAGTGGDDVNEYSLSTAWDISTASYSQNFSVFSQASSLQGIFFKPDGTKMYVVDSSQDWVVPYSLSTAWDVSTASWDGPTSDFFDVSAQEATPSALFFKPDGTKMYILGDGGNDVNEYSLSTAWDISTASYSQNFSVNTEETSPLGIFFKPDGTKMYVCGSAGDDVNEYSLSTAWDISTASYSQNFSVATEETAPTALFFKDDGTKMYIIGTIGDDVNEYSLSTAWDISTASYVQNFSVATEETAPSALFFKDDGTKMFVLGIIGDAVSEYTLSTAWDISTASYSQNFSVLPYDTTTQGLFFKGDGTKMYILSSFSFDAVWAFDIG